MIGMLGTGNLELVEGVRRYSLSVYSLIVNHCLRSRRRVRPRYNSVCCLGMFKVRAKNLRQDTANLKNLSLCNQKYR